MSTPRVPFDSPAVTNQIVGDFHDQPEGLYIVRTSNLTEHPKPATDRDDIRADLVITGYVVVRQNRPVKAKSLVVELLTEVELVLPSKPMEKDVIYRNKLELVDPDRAGIVLDCRTQFFEFACVVPCTIAGFDRTPFGRVSHRLQATLEGETQTVMGRATSPRFRSWFGLSDNKGDLRAGIPNTVVDSDLPWLSGTLTASKEIWIIPLVTDNRQSLPLSTRRASLVQGLGTIVWDAWTANLTVAGIVFFTLRIESPGRLATVWSIRLTLEQSFVLESPRSPGSVIRPESTESLLFARGRLPDQQDEFIFSKVDRDLPLWQGDEAPGPAKKRDPAGITVRETLRLPNDDRLRPSTCPGTATPIRVKHCFKLTIFFSVWGQDVQGRAIASGKSGELRKATLVETVMILPCCCASEYLELPPYQEPAARPTKPLHDRDVDICVCKATVDELLMAEAKAGATLENKTADSASATQKYVAVT